jgi:hypothetical protein
MENFETQQPRTRIDEAKNLIVRFSESIEEEFQRAGNSWFACFRGHLDPIDIYLFGEKAEKELGAEKYDKVQKVLEALKQKVSDLKQEYPDRNTIPPDDIKKDLLDTLLSMLDILE